MSSLVICDALTFTFILKVWPPDETLTFTLRLWPSDSRFNLQIRFWPWDWGLTSIYYVLMFLMRRWKWLSDGRTTINATFRDCYSAYKITSWYVSVCGPETGWRWLWLPWLHLRVKKRDHRLTISSRWCHVSCSFTKSTHNLIWY